MNSFKLLFVEDEKEALESFDSSLLPYEKSNDCKIEVIKCRTFEDACIKIDNSFDGAIIDIKLNKDDNAGNRIIENIRNRARIPFAIHTGQPYNTEDIDPITKVFIKGEPGAEYKNILDYLMGVYQTGLTKIFGGRGKIEKAMNTVFWKNILPCLPSWKSHVRNGDETEKALLRFTLNHLMEILDEDESSCFEEEMYISPSFSMNIRTGSILTEKQGSVAHIVLTPACDLVIRRNGRFKTDRVLICAIDDLDPVSKEILDDLDNLKIDNKKKKKRKQEEIKNLLNNNYTTYYHWLPKTEIFRGGLLNFRKVRVVEENDIQKEFNTPDVQISSHFIKDIIRRFSSFYSRQGQPDFKFREIAKQIIIEQSS